jgi:FkbM family methyltransferase
VLQYLRRKIRRNPHLRERLLPLWIQLHHLHWQLRNVITRRRPISFNAGDYVIKLHCDGQIPEALYFGFEAIERDFVATYLRSNMCVVDVGANVGLYTVMASVLVGPSGVVHAFEPSAMTHQLLIRNLELNGCQNVIPNKLALSNSNERMVLRADPLDPSYDAHRFVETINSVDQLLDTDEVVKCLTLDEYALNIENIDFMKIDVEGAELMVLKGAAATLAKVDEMTLMLECSTNEDEVAEFLIGYGYNFFVWDVSNRVLKPSSFEEAIRIGNGNVFARRKPWKT